MSAIIWLGLILMWVIILVPMWLRRHDEAQEARSADRFSSAMHTLSRRDRDADAGRNFVVMPRGQSLEVHVSGASDPAATARPARSRSQRAAEAEPSEQRASATARAAAKQRLRATKRKAAQTRRANRPQRAKAPMTAAARRRRTLLGLLGAAMVTLIAAVLLGGLVWVVQGIADIGLVAFVGHLRNRAISAGARPSVARPQVKNRPAQPQAQAAPVRRAAPDVSLVHAGRRAAPVADEIYDDRRVDEPRRTPAMPAAASADGFFDQTAVQPAPAVARRGPVQFEADDSPYDETLYEEAIPRRAAATADPFYDHEAPIEVPIEVPIPSERIEAYARELDLDLPVAKPLRKPARSVESDDDIGARPWEPVPVPRPTYTTKPAAPARRPRAPLSEPLLPPTETAAELNPIDDLEEILDRRWAVND